MSEVKIIHLADVHYSPDHKEEALASLRTAIEKGRDEGVDLFAIAGDLFDRAIQNTANSGLPALQRIIQQMMDLAPVVAVTGTPTHDVKGCYEVLRETYAAHRFTVLNPHHAYYLIGGDVYSDQEEFPMFGEEIEADLLILGCPEPSKEWFLKDKRMGREEANEAIITGMRSMLMGFGAIRKEHPDIPCLFVYHGSIAGKTLCNGQTLPGRDIEIGRDDLAMVGADYYALGHIHLAQQIGDLPAFYGGSVAPWDWGELDQKGFFLIRMQVAQDCPAPPPVEIGWDRFPFPHPPRKKIVFCPGTEITEDVEGYQVRVICKGTKEETATFNADERLQELTAMGALPGSEVKIEIIPTETVRAGHIQEAKSLRGKVEIYSENSGETAGLNILDKADELELQAKTAGEIGEGLHISIDKLVLRGAIGIWKGQGKDEICLDMENFDAGIVALVGVNGAGKTTLIENMHPYPEMLTRPGKLQDHFRLRDSYRDLYFTDERTGSKYRAFIQIDGQNPSGKCEYHLYKNGQPLTDGRKESYVGEITRLFGSQALFLRSAFVSQKPTKGNPDLAEAAKGEKRAIFRELGGLDYLQAHAKAAKGNADALEGDVLRDQGKAEALEALVQALPDKQMELAGLGNDLVYENGILEQAETIGHEAKEALDKLAAELSEQRLVQQKIDSGREQEKNAERERDDLADARTMYTTALEGKPDAEKQIAEYESLKEQEAKLNEEKAGILEQRELIRAKHRDITDIALAAIQKIDAKKVEKAQEKAVFCTKKARFLTQIENLIEQTEQPLERNCPTCGQRLPGGKLVELMDEFEAKQDDLKNIQALEFEVELEITSCEKQIDELDLQKGAVAKPEEPELPEVDESAFIGVRMGLSHIDIDSARETLAQAQKAATRIAENEKRVGQLTALLNDLSSTIGDLEDRIDPELEPAHVAAGDAYETSKADYILARERVKGLEVQQESLQTQVAELEKQSEELHKIIQSIKEKQAEAADWGYLMRACGPDGIQALELDAMAPDINAHGSVFLKIAHEANPWDTKTAQGNPYDQIEIRTLREGGSGSKRKQIEDFLIFAHDTRDDTWSELSMISGGESVWVKRSVYDAFGIKRAQSRDQRFLTVFQDESDGSLDPANRLAYFRMLEAAHQESGRRHTIVITHSETAQEMISQRIEMGELGNQEAAK